MARMADAFPGAYKAEHFANGDGTYRSEVLTIESVYGKQFDNGDHRRVAKFAETPNELVLNKTNWEGLAQITGQPDDDYWGGHKVELWVDPNVFFAGKTVPGIRVRRPQQGQSAAAPPAASSPPPAAASAPPPAAAPAASVLAGWDKNRAWSEWEAHQGGDVNTWSAAIAAAGKPEAEFTASDWEGIGLSAQMPV